MNGTYIKEGSSARVTTLRGRTFEATARESGLAGFSGARFFSASVEARQEIHEELLADARALHGMVAAAVGERAHIERLRAVCGAAIHRFDPEEGERRAWDETHAILHATLLAPSGARISVLRGGPSTDAIDSGEVASIAAALSGASARPRLERRAPLSLSASVAAAIAAEIARREDLASRFPVAQESHPDYRVDGEGFPILRFEASGLAASEWPNVFRPSYRSPAIAALMHVELAASSSEKPPRGAIEVLELLRPPHLDEAGVAIDGLCSRGGESFLASFEIPMESLAAARPSGESRVWYPFHAGAWGRPITVADARLR